ncbi:Protein FAM175B [Camponotus floridanus]|uniref:BRISC complex subunit FAM175B n=2 Tax=Camponotus floridanus TaxID=104421 RepID=F175B_CAMFO|nr:BRISC complex subunit FAM175B [Camponotus floridanus]XP_019882846.1 BRISC complex subunit FAM175B [Camponotus floridanus]E2AB17.1 RecName: Full=BRISC complex subunit FAM175B; AltName: Full=BRISC complex subunit KIAA0157 homolog [Camponotus floridanus]EFN69293.1 Protein FAM175B [Camponotus floridanus]
MADSDLLVTISGAALSLLFFENVRSVGNQMGFLLGEALEFIVKTYTDSDNQVETVKIHINVEAIVTCPLADLLHDSTNHINKEKLKDFVRDKSKQVIGWFCFRRNTTNLTLTLKDKLLHKQFASHFSGVNGCKEDFFLTCLLNASTSETSGTHKFRHVFLRHNKRGMFEPISLKINNLGDDASRHDGSDYKPTPVRKSTRTPDSFTKLIESLNLDVARIDGLDSAMLIQKAAEHHLMSLIPKVCESDLEVAELEKQVHELKIKIATQQLAKRLKINGENCDRISKASKDNCFSEKIDSSKKNEVRIGDDACLQREHIPSCTQSVGPNNRTVCRNTAACIAKSAEKSRRAGRSNLQESGNQQQETQNFFTNSRRSIPEIATESICQEGSEISMGRGRGSGRGSHEFTPGMKKIRRTPGTSHMHSSRERSTTPPEQDFSDAECPISSPVLRSYSQVTKKTNLDKCNSMAPLDI